MHSGRVSPFHRGPRGPGWYPCDVLTDSPCPQTEDEPRATVVARQLRERILTGRLVSGDRLKDLPLSEEFGVSRNTVRDALGQLAGEGLAVYRRNAGCSVTTLTTGDVRDIFTVRRALESVGVDHSADADLSGLHRQLDRSRQAAEHGDWTGLGTSSLRLHQQIVGFVGSTRLDSFCFSILAQLRLVLAVMPDEGEYQREWFDRDRELVDALESGRHRQAQLVLTRYLADAERQIIDALRGRDTGGGTGRW